MLSILEMLVKFFLQSNFLDRCLKDAKSLVEISLVLFFQIFVKYRLRQQFLCTATTNFPTVFISL
jgi:hypothetical protein